MDEDTRGKAPTLLQAAAPKTVKKTAQQERVERQAQALRANLKRRKEQGRERKKP